MGTVYTLQFYCDDIFEGFDASKLQHNVASLSAKNCQSNDIPKSLCTHLKQGKIPTGPVRLNKIKVWLDVVFRNLNHFPTNRTKFVNARPILYSLHCAHESTLALKMLMLFSKDH